MTTNRAHVSWELPLTESDSDPLEVARSLSATLTLLAGLPHLSIHLWAASGAGSIQINDPWLGPAVRRTAVDRLLDALRGEPATLIPNPLGWDQYLGYATFKRYRIAVFAVISHHQHNGNCSRALPIRPGQGQVGGMGHAPVQGQGDRKLEDPYRVKDVAAALDVSVHTIYRDIRSGRLRALRLGRGRGTLRIPRDAVAAYHEHLSNNAIQSDGAASACMTAPRTRIEGDDGASLAAFSPSAAETDIA